jgi:hypothetical protein
MKTQKEITFDVISSARNNGMTNEWIITHGPAILRDMFFQGDWTVVKGSTDEDAILKYSRALIKNSLLKDVRLNGGTKYTPKTRRVKDPDGSNLLLDSAV